MGKCGKAPTVQTRSTNAWFEIAVGNVDEGQVALNRKRNIPRLEHAINSCMPECFLTIPSQRLGQLTLGKEEDWVWQMCDCCVRSRSDN